MMRPLSLRARLVGLTVMAVAAVWLVTSVITWFEIRHELEELLAHPPSTSTTHLDHERSELASEIAEQLLMPMLIALPALAVLLVIAIGLALAPLRQLASDVSARGPDRLDPLPMETLPVEVTPLVSRLNSLFADIMRALENERRLTADAAHELRTPLAALRAQAEVALASVDAEERQRALRQILAGCDRATHLVAQLLTLARLDAGAASPMHALALRAIAEDVLASSAGDAIERNCELSLREGDACVKGDALLLQVMLRNLIDNALRHSGGSQIEVAVESIDAQAVLTVSDNGRGIADDERSHVEQRFYRSASADSGDNTTGSGLGLSIVRRIAELHAGNLELRPASSGHGLVAQVSLPIHAGVPGASPGG